MKGIESYAEQTAQALNALIARCQGETLPFDIVESDFTKPLLSDTLKTLAEFIEYSDVVNTNVLASTVALIQIHDSRLRGLLRDNHDPSRSRVVSASIYRHPNQTMPIPRATRPAP
jgi:hypothetical protein